jgi:hypothetical protein
VIIRKGDYQSLIERRKAGALQKKTPARPKDYNVQDAIQLALSLSVQTSLRGPKGSPFSPNKGPLQPIESAQPNAT